MEVEAVPDPIAGATTGAEIGSRYEVTTSMSAVHRIRGAFLMAVVEGSVGRPTAMTLSADCLFALEGKFALAV